MRNARLYACPMPDLDAPLFSNGMVALYRWAKATPCVDTPPSPSDYGAQHFKQVGPWATLVHGCGDTEPHSRRLPGQYARIELQTVFHGLAVGGAGAGRADPAEVFRPGKTSIKSFSWRTLRPQSACGRASSQSVLNDHFQRCPSWAVSTCADVQASSNASQPSVLDAVTAESRSRVRLNQNGWRWR